MALPGSPWGIQINQICWVPARAPGPGTLALRRCFMGPGPAGSIILGCCGSIDALVWPQLSLGVAQGPSSESCVFLQIQ